jgi:hypothetical protein
MDRGELPTLEIKSRPRGDARMLLVVAGMCVTFSWMYFRSAGWPALPFFWGMAVVALFAAIVFGVRMAVPSRLILDVSGLTWKVTGWPARRYLWPDIEKFGVVPPRPPLIDPLIGYTFRPGKVLGPLLRASWTGYDATISGSWELEPQALVDTLDKYLVAARARTTTS